MYKIRAYGRAASPVYRCAPFQASNAKSGFSILIKFDRKTSKFSTKFSTYLDNVVERFDILALGLDHFFDSLVSFTAGKEWLTAVALSTWNFTYQMTKIDRPVMPR